VNLSRLSAPKAVAVAPTLILLLLARFVQGASAAMLMPNSLAILGQSFSGEAKGRAIGIWAATGAAAGAIGPVLGGWLIDAGSWRLAFLINVPLSVAAVVLAPRYVDRDVTVVIALGMAGAVAPLATAVLISVDGSHTGAASEPNSAVARTGGLVAISLIGPVIASSGSALLSAFGVAAAMGAVICLVAAAGEATLIAPAKTTIVTRSTRLPSWQSLSRPT
jgi:MFS family permease